MKSKGRKAWQSVLGIAALASVPAMASTSYGDLNNFDCINDTGEQTHGFEIEIDDAHSTDVSYTYDWNHYGTPVIREDSSNPLHPKVFVRYAAQSTGGGWSAYTAVPAAPLAPTDGHACTDPSVNQGCEHFGVGINGAPSAVKYNWLIADPLHPGQLKLGPAVSVSTPVWTYTPPVLVNPAQPPDPANIKKPAQVVAAIPAPEEPVPAGKAFGPPSWMKVIKTTTHNAKPVALGDLMSDDINGDGKAEWQNGEPDEVETEWKLVQNRADGKDQVQALAPDGMGNGKEVVTRRYEFYAYNDPHPIGTGSIDGESGEAMCDQVAADGIHGVGTVSVTNASGNSYDFNCATLAVVGDYQGAQMAAFAAEAPLGLIEHLQDGEAGVAYTPRVVVVGGNTPYQITPSNLPAGLTLGEYTDPNSGARQAGVLYGTPLQAGDFDLQVVAQDASGASSSASYTLHIGGVAPQQYTLSVSKTGKGSGTVSGGAINCGNACSTRLAAGASLTLSATAAAKNVFTGWSGACSGLGNCSISNIRQNLSLSASFVPNTTKYTLTVSKTGKGTVSSSPLGVSCGLNCSGSFKVGTVVKLSAKPGLKQRFLGWGGACAGTASSCTVPMYAAQSVSASFGP